MTGYRALCIRLSFGATSDNGENLEAWNDPDRWELSEDYMRNCTLKAQVREDLCTALRPFTDHFASIDCIRADGSSSLVFGGKVDDEDREQTFYLVFRADDDVAEQAKQLAELGPDLVVLSASLCECVISAGAEDVDAGSVFDVLATRETNQDVGIWGGANTPHLLPQPGEARAAWLERVALPSCKVEALFERWEAVGQNIEFFKSYGAHDERGTEAEKFEWLVDHRFARRVITSLVGNNQAGKSSIAHEWVAALTGESEKKARTILGHEIVGRFSVALISGEETPGIIKLRAQKHSTVWGKCRYHAIDGMNHSFDELMMWLEALPVLDLVVFDPVRYFLQGDEDSSNVATSFYERLNQLAQTKNCAVIVVHHLSKGIVRSLGNMLPRVRGSGVHTDRPRLVIGAIHRGGDIVEIGPIKNNLGKIWAEVNQGTLYRRDPGDSHTLLPINDGARTKPGDVPELGPEERVHSAVLRLNRAGKVVRRSGKCGLFEMRLPELDGISRDAVLDAIGALLSSGKLENTGEAGIVAINTGSAG